MDKNSEPKYKIGQKVKVSNWVGETESLEILDIKRIYHERVKEYTWGYKMNGYTGLTFSYVPEGYLRSN
jgi:hypothetical protein